MYGADDFLPVLTYVIAQCDMLELDTEIEYMMELLDPSLLHGEGNNHLMTWEELGYLFLVLFSSCFPFFSSKILFISERA